MVLLTANLKLTTQFRDWLPDVDAVNKEQPGARWARTAAAKPMAGLRKLNTSLISELD